jgi:ABC-2 type transport system permease protein
MTAAKKYTSIAKLSLLNAIHYPANIVSRLLLYTVFISVFYFLWGTIYQDAEVHGYSFTQLIWYLCFTEFVVFCCRSAIYDQMNEDVKSGSIAYLLTRPCHYIFFQFFTSSGELALNCITFGAYAIFLAMIYVGPLVGFSFMHLPLILLSAFLGVMLNFFMLIILGLTAFIWEENTGFYFVYQKLIFILGMFFPVEFLPYWLQDIAKSLPFSYVAWAPARLAVAYSNEFLLFILPRQIFWVLLAVSCSLLLYNRAVRYLQGQGG